MKTGITALLSLLIAMLPASQASAQILTQGYEWNVTEGQIFNAGEEYKITCTVTNPNLSTPIRFKYTLGNSTYFIATDNGIMCTMEPTGFDSSWCLLKISSSPYSSGDFSGTDAMFTVFAGTADGCMAFLRNYGNGAYPYFAKWADDTHKSLILCRGGRDGTLTIPGSLNHRIPGYTDDLPIVSIADGAFKSNTDITDVVFDDPAPDLRIGSDIFAEGALVKSVSINTLYPPVCADDAFDAIASTATLTVPVGSVLAYRRAAGWKRFAKVVNTNGDTEQDIISGNYKARLSDDFSDLTITGIVNEVSELIIPATLEVEGVPVPVNAVGEDAFYANTYIKSIIIESGTADLTLGKRCFAEIPFTFLKVDRNLARLDDSGMAHPFRFGDDAPAASLVIGDNVTIVPDNAFNVTGNKRYSSLTLGRNITHIGYGAFLGFSRITELILPEKLRQVRSDAFHGASLVKRLVIPQSVTSIETLAFCYMKGLETVEFAGSLEGGSIGNQAFQYTTSIREVVLRSATPIAMQHATARPFDAAGLDNAILVVTAGSLATYEEAPGWKDFDMIVDSEGNFHRDGFALRFTDAERTEAVVTGVVDKTDTELTIPETMTKPRGTFRITGFIAGQFVCRMDTRSGYDNQISIKGLANPDKVSETLTIPGKLPYFGQERVVSMIMDDAFAGNSRIKDIIIESGEGEICLGDRCFANVPFTSFIIDRNFIRLSDIESLSPFMFKDGAVPLAALTLGDNMTEVGTKCFYNDGHRFNKVFLSDNIRSIGDYSFYRFTNLTELKLSANLGHIGERAFSFCGVKSLVIPASVRSIGKYAFYSMGKIKTLEFEGDTEDIIIGNYAFDDCIGLENVKVRWCSPVEWKSDTYFSRFGQDAVLHVPEGSVAAYANADVWKGFKSITDGTASWPHDVTVSIPDHASFTLYNQITPLSLNIKSNEGWTVHSVTHNDADVKALLDADGNYAVGNAEAGEHNVNVVFEKNIPTGIDTVDSDLKDICVTVKNGTIYICGAPADVTAELYDLNGLCVYAGNDRTISVNSRGVFILRIGYRTFKLQV